ncbi:Alkaline phosphatase synthesis sensor protein PhoR [Pelotomaculum schinkii]|uniref:histidine kinase n=1 Tax=Pelotomaculum schinkii TaxID=78350 RepID=A0A4Y7RIV2_9FIRM|nr:HAMP domain-containing sensor histidine kinase [Pelotomaculum schinkii]TEB08649.1 Alkaline phosphatase synthesis sensor protein PhoR [Pelotomaculum schinkii]
MKGIRVRLTANFMIVIIFTVAILEMLLIYIVRQNYYSSLEGSLSNQIKICTEMYTKYFSDTSLQDNVLYNVDAFWNQSNAEVQIVDKNGNIVMDSQGSISQEMKGNDIEEALTGKTGVWVGYLNGQKVMAVANPLKSDNQIVGALRFIASLSAVDQDIVKTEEVFILIGLFVILIVGSISIFLANTITVPLQEVTAVAQRMAAGNFQIKSRKTRDDEIGKLSDTLNYLADEIVKKEQLKNDFISSVSHELRTPLTSIKGWAITLQSESFQQKEMLKDGLNIISKESERLTQMVEELLDFSKFVSGRIKLNAEDVNLVNLFEHLRKQLTPRAVRENIDFTVDYPENMPNIYSDANRLKQLFINILDNAFNFNHPGGYVHFKAEVQEEGFKFTISDNGCGIAADELPMVKEKFYKGKSSHSKNGIGLSICEEIVNLMGGKLEISSELNKGTDVVITLPKGERPDA